MVGKASEDKTLATGDLNEFLEIEEKGRESVKEEEIEENLQQERDDPCIQPDFNKIDTMKILLEDVLGKDNFHKAYKVVRQKVPADYMTVDE